ncbi:[FeFe] hydrogenase H-cluster radical SAM maturase HydG [Candidatus Margulisiibacteriota bacterium]
MQSFVNEDKIKKYLTAAEPSKNQIKAIIQKSLSKKRLELPEVAALLNILDRDLLQEVFDGAKKLKEKIYGNRIVIFAPLYIGNDCINDCKYCAFRKSNKKAKRRTLSEPEIKKEIETLESQGHKRLILVFGEHPKYNTKFIAKTVKQAYSIKFGKGSIRRVNINAPPFEVEEYKILKEVGIGTYQIFQETYHKKTYKQYHPKGKKADFLWRLYGLDRAQRAGLDDVGIGALFGLYDWRFEVMGLVAHTIHLEKEFNVGPHTISFPRVQPAQGVRLPKKYSVSDQDFKKIVAVLRLAIPYTGLILTCREKPKLRREVIELGCSQIDAGSRIELGGYSDTLTKQESDRQQFKLGDTRSLDQVMRELLEDGYIPSFCTACYRLGRTGEHFMEFAKAGFIQNYCTPNALLTLKEYLEDYAHPDTKKVGEEIIKKQAPKTLSARLAKIEAGERDVYC